MNFYFRFVVWVVHLVVLYDLWCMSRVVRLLLWLEEWCSISQKDAERGMIALYVILQMVPHSLGMLAFKCVTAGWVGWLMWIIHRRPAASRARLFFAIPMVNAFRVSFQILTAALIAIFLMPPIRLDDSCSAVAQVVYMLFFYATDISINGDRGGRRKLALAELKKLFGTEWIPRPLPVPE